MPSSPPRLARVHRWAGPATWYLEPDCLLLSDQRWWVAEYRRFYYSDLRSITAWPRPRWIWRLLASPLLIALPVFLAALAPSLIYTRHVTAALQAAAAAAGAVILVQLVLGPYSSTRVVTLYSSFNAPLVHRWRSAERVLRVLAPRMAGAQTAPSGDGAGAAADASAPA